MTMDSSNNWLTTSLDLNVNPLRLFDDSPAPVRENALLMSLDKMFVGMISYVLNLKLFLLQKEEVHDDFTELGLKVSLEEEEVSNEFFKTKLNQ